MNEIKGKVIVTNAFVDFNDPTYSLVGCSIIDGTIDIGNFLIIDRQSKLLISKIENPLKDSPTEVILSVSKIELSNLKVPILRNKEYEIGGSVSKV